MSGEDPVATVITREPILTREEIGDLIDSLPETELHSVKRYLQFMHYLDDPETLGRVEAQAIAEGLKPRGKPKKKSDIAHVTSDDAKKLLEGIEDYRLIPAGWFIRFSHSKDDNPAKCAGATTEGLTHKGENR